MLHLHLKAVHLRFLSSAYSAISGYPDALSVLRRIEFLVGQDDLDLTLAAPVFFDGFVYLLALCLLRVFLDGHFPCLLNASNIQFPFHPSPFLGA